MEKTKYSSLTDGLTDTFLKRTLKSRNNGWIMKEKNIVSFLGKIPPKS